MFEKLFKLKENHTTAKTEIMAGITTFMTMAYILAVNPSTMTAFNDVLGLEGAARMNPSGVFMATALAAVVGTLNGIKCLFLLDRCCRHGLQLADCPDRCICGRSDLYPAVTDQCAGSYI